MAVGCGDPGETHEEKKEQEFIWDMGEEINNNKNKIEQQKVVTVDNFWQQFIDL